MRHSGAVRILRVITAVLLLNANWSGDERLPLYEGTPTVKTRPVTLGPGDPKRVGDLTFMGGLHFYSRDHAFGGYSSLHTDGRKFSLLSDGGLWFDFEMGSDLRPYRPRFGTLPDGPAQGWRKIDRDSEAQAVDPATGQIWVAFERANMIWRYAPGYARVEAKAAPAAMASWPRNSGAEAMVRLRRGAFLVFSEGNREPGGGTTTLYFPGDPTAGSKPVRLAFVAPDHFDVTDAAELPDGRLIVLTRRARLAVGFTNKLVLVEADAIRAAIAQPGARVRGREIATLAPPLIHDNFEGVAVTREGRATIVWLVSDDNSPTWFQRTLLLKFRLEP